MLGLSRDPGGEPLRTTDLRVAAEVIKTARTMARSGLVRGTSGNVSARTTDEAFAITPSGMPYHAMCADDVALLRLVDGQLLEGIRRPSTEWPLHAEIYRSRPDVTAIVHTHSTFATTLAIAGETLPPVHYLLAAVGGEVGLAPYRTFGTAALGAAIVEGLGQNGAVLMENHGVVTVGGALSEALMRAEMVETVAELFVRARSAGLTPRRLSDEEMARVAAAMVGYGDGTRGV